MLSLFVEFYLKLSMINEELALTTLVDEHIFGPEWQLVLIRFISITNINIHVCARADASNVVSHWSINLLAPSHTPNLVV